MSSRLFVALVWMAAAGCRFDAPSFDGTSFRCEPPDQRCPEGFRCEDGVCVGDGDEPDAPAADADAPPGGDAGDRPDAFSNSTPTFGNRPDADFQDVADDTTLVEDDPDAPFGALEAVNVDSSPVRAGLVQFDLRALPITSVVTSAELEVTIFDPLENGTFEGYAVLQSWSEISGTWNVRITGLPWTGAGVTGASRGARIATFAPRNAGTATVTISAAAVQGWISAPTSNHGIVWISTSIDGRGGQFHSNEHPVALERPILRLTLAQ